jgi:hypothetical protein
VGGKEKPGTVNLIDDFNSIFGGNTNQPTTTQQTSTNLLTSDIFGISTTPTAPTNVFNLIPETKPTQPQTDNAFNLLNNLGNVKIYNFSSTDNNNRATPTQ